MQSPNRRAYVRTPKKPEFARKPLMRIAALLGGPKAFAAFFGGEPHLFYNWKNRNDGFFPTGSLEEAKERLVVRGEKFEPGFLTDEGRFAQDEAGVWRRSELEAAE